MNQVLNSMLESYLDKKDNIEDVKNSIKQVVQEIILCGLSRSDFFTYAAFNGETALRIFYKLNRFSEDLDFSIISKQNDFDLNKYKKVIDEEFQSLGLNITFDVDSTDTLVKRAYVKGNLNEILESFGVVNKNINKNDLLKIKLEVDETDFEYAKVEVKYLIKPYPSAIKIYDASSLFAGKLDAVLTRTWKQRVKGRDYYDYLFYVVNNYSVNMKHLKERLINSNCLKQDDDFDTSKLKKLLIDKFDNINYALAKKDVLPFIKDKKEIDFWSKDMFITITKDHEFKESE